jgi:ABC-2 type transport system ATP-binding protein
MEYSLQVEHLSKKFGEFTAVDDISFNVRKSEIFAFLGPNGAGKSTTIKMLTTLLIPTSGKINVNGFNPSIEQDAVRKSFGIVFQDSSLDEELTAYENMDYHGILYHVPVDLRKQRIEELLHVVELWDRKDNLVKTFSGGMKRRLEIARGLLHHPKIFFLDEPTIGLDPQTRNQMWEYVKGLNKKEGITIFFTTHYLEEAQKMAQTVCIIDHGEIAAQGSTEQLEQRTGTTSLEEAFLSLTGKEIREEAPDVNDFMRRRMRGR